MTFISNHKQKIISSYISATVSSHPELEKHPTLPLVYQKNRNPHQIPILSGCLLYTSPSPRDTERSRMPSSA